MQGRRLRNLDPISSPCEGIGELKHRPQKSTFNASDREFLFRTWVTGGIEKTCLRHSSLFSNALIVIQNQKKKTKKKKKKKKKNVVDVNCPLLMMTGNFVCNSGNRRDRKDLNKNNSDKKFRCS